MDATHLPLPNQLTFRLQNIPHYMTPEDLVQQFHPQDRENISVRSFCPEVEAVENEEGKHSYTATIFHNPRDPFRLQPDLVNNHIDMDKDFTGFTPLYVPKKGKIDAEYPPQKLYIAYLEH
ncbi:hypothetical protein M1813_007436 [Neofusicoccum parvum]|uniref:Uncharacterized protein n=1 Tax=Neofusicoccum parvum TaxID=310453 RepID=A0ACB5SPW6_9PEZI|nr:hypothetical protein M1813_007436 [Neofusicoccum parvum]